MGHSVGKELIGTTGETRVRLRMRGEQYISINLLILTALLWFRGSLSWPRVTGHHSIDLLSNGLSGHTNILCTIPATSCNFMIMPPQNLA